MDKERRFWTRKNVFRLLILLFVGSVLFTCKCWENITSPQYPIVRFIEATETLNIEEMYTFNFEYLCPGRYYKEGESPRLKGYLEDSLIFSFYADSSDTSGLGWEWEPLSIMTSLSYNYDITAIAEVWLIYKDYGDSKEEWDSTYSYQTVYWKGGGPAQNRYLIKWTGDEQLASPNEVIAPPSAYPISVRLVDETGINGIQGEPVSFTTTWGTFEESNSAEYTVNTFQWNITLGIAYARLQLPGIGNAQVTVSSEFCADCIFNIYCGNDDELSHLDGQQHDPNYPHQRWSYPDGAEIPGDGFALLKNYDTDKDLFVEVDYQSGLNRTQIESACDDAKCIFATAGVVAHFTVDEEIPLPDEELSYQERKEMYAQHRDYGLYKYVYVFIGGRCVEIPDAGGITDNIIPADTHDIKVFFECIHKATGGFDSYTVGNYTYLGCQGYLDSVGCTVFSARLNELLNPLNQITLYEAIGLVMAHELGHAVGMEHTDEHSQPWLPQIGCMSWYFPFDVPDMILADYDYFIRGSLDDCDDDGNPYYLQNFEITVRYHNDYDAMDLRDILGINNVMTWSDVLYFPVLQP